MTTASASLPVLVVDDDPDILAAVEQILQIEGYTVASARNGEEALAVLDSVQPAVILLDLMMPVMDGEEFRRRLAEHPAADTPVVVISADRDLARKAASMQVEAYLAKPFDLDDLIATVERFVRGE